MPDLVLELLKYVFLAVLYIFIARAVRAVYIDLKPATATAPRTAPAPAPSKPPARRTKKAPGKLVVLEGESASGKSFDLGDELMIGRADQAQVVLKDSYASQMHARVFRRGEQYMVEDLGSTNGTYLNGRKLTSTTEVLRGDRIKIGKTVLELRK